MQLRLCNILKSEALCLRENYEDAESADYDSHSNRARVHLFSCIFLIPVVGSVTVHGRVVIALWSSLLIAKATAQMFENYVENYYLEVLLRGLW